MIPLQLDINCTKIKYCARIFSIYFTISTSVRFVKVRNYWCYHPFFSVLRYITLLSKISIYYFNKKNYPYWVCLYTYEVKRVKTVIILKRLSKKKTAMLNFIYKWGFLIESPNCKNIEEIEYKNNICVYYYLFCRGYIQ